MEKKMIELLCVIFGLVLATGYLALILWKQKSTYSQTYYDWGKWSLRSFFAFYCAALFYGASDIMIYLNPIWRIIAVIAIAGLFGVGSYPRYLNHDAIVHYIFAGLAAAIGIVLMAVLNPWSFLIAAPTAYLLYRYGKKSKGAILEWFVFAGFPLALILSAL